MNYLRSREFRLIAEGSFRELEEAKHALIDPFIEDFVEETGRFKVHNFDNLHAASGVLLSDLSIEMIDEGLFEISTRHSAQILNRRRAEQLAATLREQGMFDKVSIEPLEE